MNAIKHEKTLKTLRHPTHINDIFFSFLWGIYKKNINLIHLNVLTWQELEWKIVKCWQSRKITQDYNNFKKQSSIKNVVLCLKKVCLNIKQHLTGYTFSLTWSREHQTSYFLKCNYEKLE